MTTLTTAQPVLVCTREVDGDDAYFRARLGGITGTELREWGSPSNRRAILSEKVTGDHDYRSNRYFEHGKYREPYLSDWAAATHGVVHTTGLYAHPDNPRHLCTPDGYLAGFTLGYEPGSEGVTVEVKTTSKDLLPGTLDAARVLIAENPDGHFATMKYMRQVQWQMYVMNAARCLFIWEPFEPTRDPETGHFIVVGPPEWCIIPRDQSMIDGLVEEADAALAQIDAARSATTGQMPPVNDVPTDEALLLMDLFAARDAIAVAEAARDRAWSALEALYADREDFSEDKGFALVTKSTGRPKVTKTFNRDLAESRAPKMLAQYDTFVARYTTATISPGSTRLTITDRQK